MIKHERVRVIYSGQVQGVGFRFTARHLAGRMNVSGFARNLPDGTVEVVGEAKRQELEAFLAKIEEEMSGYIGSTNVTWGPSQKEFTTFEIRF